MNFAHRLLSLTPTPASHPHTSPDTGTDEVIPLPNVNGKILAKVIEYSRYHVEAAKKGADDKPAKSEDDVKQWDTEFVKVDQATLFDLILVGVLRARVCMRVHACLRMFYLSAQVVDAVCAFCRQAPEAQSGSTTRGVGVSG